MDVGSQMLLSLLLLGYLHPLSRGKDRNANLLFRNEGWHPTRDRTRLEFPNADRAIEHSRELARRLRHDPRRKDPALFIIVVDESGAEIHRDPVHPDAPK